MTKTDNKRKGKDLRLITIPATAAAVIGYCHYGVQPNHLYQGDVNGDNRIDVITEAPGFFGFKNYRLFLQDENGKLIQDRSFTRNEISMLIND